MNHYNVKLRCFIRLRKRGVEGSVFLFFRVLDYYYDDDDVPYLLPLDTFACFFSCLRAVYCALVICDYSIYSGVGSIITSCSILLIGL